MLNYQCEIRRLFRGLFFLCPVFRSRAEIPVYPLLTKETLIPKAVAIKEAGIKRFSLVTSGKKVSKRDLRKIAGMIPEIRNLSLFPCASLGLLNKKEPEQLRDAGLDRITITSKPPRGSSRKFAELTPIG